MRLFLLISAIALLFTVARPPASIASEPVRFCFNFWPPYAYRDENGNPRGISIDLIRLAAQNLNMETEFVLLPWKRCLQEVKTGKIHAVIDAAKREEYLQGPTSHSLYTNTVWVHRDSPLTALSSMNTLRNKIAGYIDGYVMPEEFTNIDGLHVDYSIDEKTAIKKLASKRVDFIIADLTNTAFIQKKQNLPIRALSPTPSADKLYISFNKDQPALQKRFDTEFSRIMNNGSLDQIYLQHIDQSYREILISVQGVLK